MIELRGLLPHAGSMVLLDRVIGHSEHDIECAARSHMNPDHPLRRDGQLSSLHLIEYAAQAMAAHGALRTGGVKQGMLAVLREVRLHVERIDDLDTELTVHATLRIAQPTGSLYEFRIHAGDKLLGEGRVSIAFV